jgi:hypothetical protein
MATNPSPATPATPASPLSLPLSELDPDVAAADLPHLPYLDGDAV